MTVHLAGSVLATRAKHTHHLHNLRVYVISDDTALGGDIFQHLVQSLGLDLLPLELGISVVEVE